MKPQSVAPQMKANEQYVSTVLFISLFKVVLTFDGVFGRYPKMCRFYESC